MSVELAAKLHGMPRPKVLVLGDIMLDVDIHGEMARYDAACPGCPVFRETHREKRPGGAAAVADMVEALGAEVDLIGNSVSVKRRGFAGGRQVWRADEDAADNGGPNPEAVKERVAWANVVLIADYGKGLCTTPIIRAAIGTANERGVLVFVDPANGRDWRYYAGATCLKCNEREWDTERAFAMRGHSDERSDTAFVVTHGHRGLELYTGKKIAFPARPRHAIDSTGCGDMVLAALGVCVAGMMNWGEACAIAVAASGLKAERHGAVPVSRVAVCNDLAGSERERVTPEREQPSPQKERPAQLPRERTPQPVESAPEPPP